MRRTMAVRQNHHNSACDNHWNGEDLPHADVLHPFAGKLRLGLAEKFNKATERALANQEQAGDRAGRAWFADKQVKDDKQDNAFQRQLIEL